MKRYLTLGLAIILTAIVALSVFPPKTNAQSAGLVSSIFSKMERNRRDLRSMRAGISMEKYNAQLRDSDKQSGTVIYLPSVGKNAFVRVDWQRPQQETLAVADGKYTLFRPRLKMAYVGDANSNRSKASSVLGFGLDATKSQLMSAYDAQNIYEETLWGGVHTTHIKLVPKGGARYSYAELWVDAHGMPVQTKVVEKNGDATTVRLMNVQRNAQVSKNEFKIDLGADIKKVRG
ncbi:MAG TPA: outer membrane lipoprotein carrier protein LolA [Pyrinomonadaceae bacterium]|nr:outer membrane lipoprotein carrier protein LolA [Pyrinomonadaceae bacterium]